MTTTADLNYVARRSPMPSRTPRLWPGVALVVLQWLVIKVSAWLAPLTMWQFMGMIWGPIIGFLGVLIWFLAFSRFSWSTRRVGLIPLLLLPVIGFVAGHHTMHMGMLVAALPIATTVFVLWLLVASFISRGQVLRAGLVIAPLLIWGFFDLRRMDGVNGKVDFTTSWRWSKNAEALYLAKIAQDPSLAGKHRAMPATTQAAPLTLSDGDWPSFRGPNRDGKLVGVSINKDCAQHPKLIWKHLIGPGWSSFTVVGDHAFTQEQRGSTERVVCYDLNTGDEIWSHDDNDMRFEEAMAGPGPRATPTFSDGKIYAQGAKGILNCLNAATGEKIWSRNIQTDTGARIPDWGFSASPLVADGLVSVITGAPGKAVTAYDANTGTPAWSAGEGWSYASMQLSRIDGVDQLLAITAAGVTSLDPLHGRILWQHSFPLAGGGNRAVQPTVFNDNDILIGAGFGVGTRRVHLTHNGPAWKDETIWTTRSIKPYYNDLVVHNGNLYGFDGDIFVCIDGQTGKPHWRAHGYGNGQVLLIADQDLLLILSETGEAALVDAKPDEWHELGRFQAVNGKTWNHPVIAHGKLLVRNGEEVACYDVK